MFPSQMFTGDGGNDVGALKTAHVGVALADNEASIVAPFTSIDKNIASVIEVLREGRCCLASAFSSYKFMIMYGQLETVLQLVAAWFAVGFAEWNWVWLDGILVVPLAFTLPLSTAAQRLGPTRPTASLLGPYTMASACGVLSINLACLCIALIVLRYQDCKFLTNNFQPSSPQMGSDINLFICPAGYQCRQWESTDISFILALGDNYESSVTFLMIASQYVFSAAAFNFGFTYRKHWLRNYPLVILVVGFMFFHYWITLVPGVVSCWLRINCVNEDNIAVSLYNEGPVALQNDYNSTLMPEEFRIFLAVLMTVNFLAVTGWEFFVVGNGYGKKLWLGLIKMCFGEGTEENDESSPLVLEKNKTASEEFKIEDSQQLDTA